MTHFVAMPVKLDAQTPLQRVTKKPQRVMAEPPQNALPPPTPVPALPVAQVQATQLSEERATVSLLGRRLAAAVALIRALGGDWGPEGARP